jgi:gliding motility-associated-like protein
MANLDLNTKIEQLFRNYSEEPSSNCWNAVSQKLDSVMPTQASVSSSSASSSSTFSKFIASTLGKTIAIVSSVAIVSVAIFAIVSSQNTTNTTNEKSKPAITQIQNEQAQPVNVKETQPVSQKQSEKSVASNNVVTTPNNAINSVSTPINSQNTIIPNSQNLINPKQNNPLVQNNTSQKTNIVSVDTQKPTISNTTEDSNDANPPSETEVNTEAKTQVNSVPTTSINQEEMVFPNVFTPNGDGFNDFFVIKNIEKISQNRLIIINSNGAKVFEANNYQNNWDASNVLNGSYFYVLETKVDGKTQSYYGSIQIIR